MRLSTIYSLTCQTLSWTSGPFSTKCQYSKRIGPVTRKFETQQIIIDNRAVYNVVNIKKGYKKNR